MPISDADFTAWLLRDNEVRVCAIQVDYQVESSGAPAKDTLYVSDNGYNDDVNSISYPDVVNSVPTFSRSLSGTRLGVYQSSLGTIEIDNQDGLYDYVLDLALDGSEIRFYYGSPSWAFSDFRLLFMALGVKASAPTIGRLSIQIKDTGLLLNKSIGGETTVGGTGPNADKARPLNFGFVQQAEFLVSDPIGLVYVHSDTGVNTTARVVRDRGASVVFTDNGDGTVTLSASPDGQITGDVLALPPVADPSDFYARRVSDAMDTFVGGRAGLADLGYYGGPHPSFVVGDSDDYELGFSVQDQRNVTDFLADLVDSGNCSWMVTRALQFTYGRLRPNDIAGLGLPATNVTDDDIDDKSVKLDHILPQYYRFQAYMDKNWTSASNLAAGLAPDEVAILSRKGLYLMQDAAVGTTYADAPEAYDLSMSVSPAIETWLSGDVDAEDLSILAAWMETRRFMFLPWIETIQVTVGLEFYALELCDVVNLTMPRFGLDAGELFQVIGINLKPSQAKIELTLIRRRLSTPYPDGWVRTTTDADADTTSALVTDTAVPPVVPPLITPPTTVTGAPWYPGNIGGLIGIGATDSGDNPYDPAIVDYSRSTHAVGQVQSFDDFNTSVAIDSTATTAVVGVSNDYLNVGTSVNGHVDVYERSGTTWTKTATLTPTAVNGMVGYTVGISDDGTIVASEYFGRNYHVWTKTAPSTWGTYVSLNDTNVSSLAYSSIAINRGGTILVVIGTSGDSKFSVWKKSGGTWSHQQTIDVSPNSVVDVAISSDGGTVVISGSDSGSPANLRIYVYRANGGLTTWSLISTLSPIADNGNTRVYSSQQIALSADASVIAAFAPNDQSSGASTSTIFIFSSRNGGVSYAQDAYIRLAPGDSTLMGSLAVSDDGNRLFIGSTYWGPGPEYTSEGHVYYVDNPWNLNGLTYIEGNSRFRMVPNPYPTTNAQHFGESLACSADGFWAVIASGDVDNLGTNTVDFFRWNQTRPNVANSFGSSTTSAVGTTAGSGGVGQVQTPSGSYLDSSGTGQAQSPDGSYINDA